VIEFSASVSPLASKESNRMLRERNPTYKPSHNGPGYLSVSFFDPNMGGDACGGDVKARNEWGFLSGSCFVARDHHGSEVLGSWKVGIVEASSGRNHIHIESYTSADCTGAARRTDNHLSRLHYFDGQKYPLSRDPRSRSYLQEYYSGGDDMYSNDPYNYPMGCYMIEERPMGWGNNPVNCQIPSGQGYFHYTGDCNDSVALRYGIWSRDFGHCRGDGMYSYMSYCNADGSTTDYNYYNPDGNSWCDANYQSGNYVNDVHCRPLHPGDDDYGGGPTHEGWNVPGHPDYSPMMQVLFGENAEGSSLEGSSLSVMYKCFSNPPCN